MPVYNPAAHQPAMADPTYGNYNQQYTGAGQQQYNYHGQPPSTQQYAPPASQPSPKQQVVNSPWWIFHLDVFLLSAKYLLNCRY